MLECCPLGQVVGDGHLLLGVQGPPLVGVHGSEGVAPRQHQHPVLAPPTVQYTVYCTVLLHTLHLLTMSLSTPATLILTPDSGLPSVSRVRP